LLFASVKEFTHALNIRKKQSNIKIQLHARNSYNNNNNNNNEDDDDYN
jgi:hypothetical protein